MKNIKNIIFIYSYYQTENTVPCQLCFLPSVSIHNPDIRCIILSVGSQLQLLRTACAQCPGYVPSQVRLSTVIPIVKYKQSSLIVLSSYCGIALPSIVAKLIDMIIIQSHACSLKTTDMQFGFKEKSSTTQCTIVVEEVINYYVKHNSSVMPPFTMLPRLSTG